jgi:peroxiredoxin family protein
VPSEPLGVLLISGSHERAHYALVLATAAAAIGRPAILFATNAGCHALADWHALDGAGRDGDIRALGVAGFAELRDAAAELGVRLIACEAGLRIAGLDPSALAPGIEVAGVVTFLAATQGGQIVTL